MSDWQNWVVALVIGLCIVRMAWGFRSFFRKAAGKKNPCAGCSCGCSCGHTFRHFRHLEKENKKKCCG